MPKFRLFATVGGQSFACVMAGVLMLGTGINRVSAETSPVPVECVRTFGIEPEVRVRIDAPADDQAKGKALLVFYALPNGNSIEETVGKKSSNTNEWRHEIQHIGAQTRFLRKMLPDTPLTVAYLEAAQKSWPAWRKKHGNDAVRQVFKNVIMNSGLTGADIVLNGHSGGGSFIFGLINAHSEIPSNIVRIAFLDSNYAYDREAGHREKLLKWLQNTNSFLCVLAYNDAAALYNGKPFVSAAGGTWGRSHAMWKDMSEEIEFKEQRAGDMLHVSALNGRAQFFLLENPRRAILHTVQVERNGFIHSILTGTRQENQGYVYYGERAWKYRLD